ncbi:unnamed protein product [Phytophthora fragariaefolia]|uniref:Unnamed protein product n=1 Tax=Phytophthora fragariaefolia TaxID=1490495 RepID=A0A9W6XPS6_9STRA|nr:unnamed protein product [Phytophthora fragariaefolia]
MSPRATESRSLDPSLHYGVIEWDILMVIPLRPLRKFAPRWGSIHTSRSQRQGVPTGPLGSVRALLRGYSLALHGDYHAIARAGGFGFGEGGGAPEGSDLSINSRQCLNRLGLVLGRSSSSTPGSRASAPVSGASTSGSTASTSGSTASASGSSISVSGSSISASSSSASTTGCCASASASGASTSGCDAAHAMPGCSASSSSSSIIDRPAFTSTPGCGASGSTSMVEQYDMNTSQLSTYSNKSHFN